MDEKQFEDIYLPNTQITNAFVNLNLLLCLRNLVHRLLSNELNFLLNSSQVDNDNLYFKSSVKLSIANC